MTKSNRGRTTIFKRLRDEFDLNQDAEVEITPSARGLLIQKQSAAQHPAQHPVDRVCGILYGICDVDIYVEEIRGK